MENPQPSLNPTQVSTPSPATPEATTSEAVSVTPAPKKKTSKILIGVLILLFVVAGGVFAYDYFKPKMREDENFPTPVPQVSAEPEVDEMSGWRTYTNGKFSFKYPEYLPTIALREKTFGEESNPDSYETSYLDPKQTGGGPGWTLALKVIGPEKNLENISLSQWVTDKERALDEFYGEDLPRVQSAKVVDGKEAILLVTQFSNFTVPTEYNLYVPVESEIYTLSFNISTNEEKAVGYSEIFDQILSTFEFVDQEAQVLNYHFVLPQGYELISSTDNQRTYGFDGSVYLTVSNEYTVDPHNLKPCDGFTGEGFCLDDGSGWGYTAPVEVVKVDGVDSDSFYISQASPDSAFHIVQTESPKIEFKMYVAGGGLDSTFNNILDSVKFK